MALLLTTQQTLHQVHQAAELDQKLSEKTILSFFNPDGFPSSAHSQILQTAAPAHRRDACSRNKERALFNITVKPTLKLQLKSK